ncbi:GIY-YIG nuclease family protein [Acetoanaerobium noterae]|uniref:GIY-YIG nuclease family protein n=1 Tax=Acetoanaerobium noterae TaxID=745369 RepID=UPI003241F1CA
MMKDKNDGVVYIGKSKNLKSRVKSYFTKSEKPEKIIRMVHNLKDVDWIVTDTHMEAQMLECALIKKLKPIYNVQFKNHQNYFYLNVGTDSRKKSLLIYSEKQPFDSYGPYRGRSFVNQLLKQLENIYPITKANDSYIFDYSVFPIKMNDKEFLENRASLIEILGNEKANANFISVARQKMIEASKNHRFETAKEFRDIISGLEYIYNNNLKSNYRAMKKAVVVGEEIDRGIKLFYIVSGLIILKRTYEDLTDEDIIKFKAEGKALAKIRASFTDEKRSLDFRKIVSLELQDLASKGTAFLEYE